MKLAVAYGGGLNSTAMLIEMHRRGIRPDVILFADTQGERPETYAAVESFSAWLVERGSPPIQTVTEGDLYADCVRRKALPAIAYGWKTCSQRYKIRPQERCLKAWAQGEPYTQAVGYDAGEPQRAKGDHNTDLVTNWYPLIEWDLDRDDCARICAEAGVTVGKSACYFCPNMRPGEIRQLKEQHPDLHQLALKMEANADLTNIKGLGRGRFAWRDLEAQCALPMFDAEAEMPCGCYDGEQE